MSHTLPQGVQPRAHPFPGFQHQRQPFGLGMGQQRSSHQQPFGPMPQQGSWTPANASSPMRPPHPPPEIIPEHLRRPVEQIDLRGEALTEDDFYEYLSHFIIFRLEKVEPHEKYDINGNKVKPTWARCTRHRLPDVDHAKTRAEIRRLNRKDRDRKKGKWPTLLKKQHSLGSKAQDQLARAQRDLAAELTDMRFHVVLEQLDWAETALAERPAKKTKRVSKRTKSHMKEPKDHVSITAYFRVCPKPDQVASELYKRLHFQQMAQNQQLQHSQQAAPHQLRPQFPQSNHPQAQQQHHPQVMPMAPGQTQGAPLGRGHQVPHQQWPHQGITQQQQPPPGFPPSHAHHQHHGPQVHPAPHGAIRPMPPPQKQQHQGPHVRLPNGQIPRPHPQMHGASGHGRPRTPIIIEHHHGRRSRNSSSCSSSSSRSTSPFSVFDSDSGGSTTTTTMQSSRSRSSGSPQIARGRPVKPRGPPGSGAAHHFDGFARRGSRHGRSHSRSRSHSHRPGKAYVMTGSGVKVRVSSPPENISQFREAFRDGFRTGRKERREEDREQQRFDEAVPRYHTRRAPWTETHYPEPSIRRFTASDVRRRRERGLSDYFDGLHIGSSTGAGNIGRFDHVDETLYRDQVRRARRELDDMMLAQEARRRHDDCSPHRHPFTQRPLDTRFVLRRNGGDFHS